MAVQEWYRGRSILVTGGLGFMGKVLLEKLLYCCPDIKNIYVLIRSKKDISSSARLKEITKLPLFERICTEKPNVLNKLIAVEGDVTMKDLGIQDENVKHQLLEEVNIVFHFAASLRLEAGLKPAVINNTLGTKILLDFCTDMKNFQVFLHLSTAFCHCEYEELEERMYEPPADPIDVINTVHWLDDKSIELITPKLLGPHPNCYTYSKRLAEHLVFQYRHKLPVCIARPSIVLPAYKEPNPGWVDNLNGPVGLLVGASKGLIRSMLCGKEFHAEVIPVDIAINGVICIAKDVAQHKGSFRSSTEEMPVYNLSSGSLFRHSWGQIIQKGKKILYEYPFETGVWYPGGNIRSSRIIHNMCVLFLHILPAYVLDFFFLLTGNRRCMVRLQNRISVGLKVLQYFTMREWYFHNDKIRNLYNSLPKEDREVFYVPQTGFDVDDYMIKIILGARVYCMKEPLSTLSKARRQLKLFYCIDLLTKVMFIGLIIWLAIRWLHPIKFLNYFTYSLPTTHTLVIN